MTLRPTCNHDGDPHNRAGCISDRTVEEIAQRTALPGSCRGGGWGEWGGPTRNRKLSIVFRPNWAPGQPGIDSGRGNARFASMVSPKFRGPSGPERLPEIVSPGAPVGLAKATGNFWPIPCHHPLENVGEAAHQCFSPSINTSDCPSNCSAM